MLILIFSLAKDLLDTLIRARDSESGVVLTNKQLFDHVSFDIIVIYGR